MVCFDLHVVIFKSRYNLPLLVTSFGRAFKPIVKTRQTKKCVYMAVRIMNPSFELKIRISNHSRLQWSPVNSHKKYVKILYELSRMCKLSIH